MGSLVGLATAGQAGVTGRLRSFDVIELGAHLDIRPLHGGDTVATGRIVATDDDWLVVRVGPHVWLDRGSMLACTVSDESGLLSFSSEVFGRSDSPHCTITLRCPENPTWADRRPAHRVMTRQPLVWSPLENGRCLIDEIGGTTVDLSHTGARFETRGAEPAVGDLIAVALHLPIGDVVTLAYVMGVNDVAGAQILSQSMIRIGFAAHRSDHHRRLRAWLAELRGSLQPS